MIRKLLTRPIWWWERRREYPIRSRYHVLPPLPVTEGLRQLVVLTTREALKDALWSAWSWYRFLRYEGFELVVASDGDIPEVEKNDARRLFPGISMFSVQSVLPYVCERQPSLETFLYQHPMGRKLGLVLALSDQKSLLYCDNDVLAFSSPAELLANADKSVPCYLVEEIDGTRDPDIVERAKAVGLEFTSKFNAGLMYVPKGSLSLDIAAQLLAPWRPPADSWFTEQTTMSVLMRCANASPLPVARYVLNANRQFYWQTDVDYCAIAARHFVSPVRHVMYMKGIPAILSQSRHSADHPEKE